MPKLLIKDLLESNLLKPIEKYSPVQIQDEIKLLKQRIEQLKNYYEKTWST